ncbi:MAG: hypothetical protein ACR2PZ_16405 [Pseudomonadales bacterium]
MYYAPRNRYSRLLLGAALLGLLLSGNVALANTYDTADRLLRLHLPVHIEGDQVVLLDQLILEHYDLDLSSYLLRGVVIESDGYLDQQHSYAQLQVGGYQSARVFVEGGQTAIDAPAYSDSQWQLQLGSGVRIHGLLLVLEERRYSTYRTRPHIASTLGLGWYLSSHAYRYPDYYYRDRYHYGSLANRRHRFHNPYYNRYHYRIQRHSEKYRRHRNAERRHGRPDQISRHRDKDRDSRENRREHKRDHARSHERTHERRHERNHGKRDRRHERNHAQRDRQHDQPRHRQWRNAGRARDIERRERSRSRPLPRQERQVERALRGNHEHARRPDRPRRQRIERSPRSPQANALASRSRVQAQPRSQAQSRSRAQPRARTQSRARVPSNATPRGNHRNQSPRLGRARSGLNRR